MEMKKRVKRNERQKEPRLRVVSRSYTFCSLVGCSGRQNGEIEEVRKKERETRHTAAQRVDIGFHLHFESFFPAL